MIDSFRAARWIRTLNLVLQAVLFLTLIGGLNYLAGSHAWRFDLTRYRKYSLSAETLSYLRELSRPVLIVVSNGQTEDPLVKGLLTEYVNATESNPGGQIKVDYVDIYQDRRKTEKYGIDQAGLVLVLCGDKRRALNIDSDMYRAENKVKKEFTGEQAMTAAILDVSNPERKKVYFLVGHAELRPDNVDPAQGLSMARDQLRQRNYDVDEVELAAARRVPADASLLISVEPQDAFSPFEQELLRQYLGAGAGRLILFLAPDTQPGLTDLLLDWGVLVDDDRVFDLGSDNLSEEGDLIIRSFAQHPITQTLLDYKEPLRIGFARSVRPLPGRPEGSGLTVTTLAATSTTAWGEIDYRNRGVQMFTPGIDLKGLPQMDPQNRLGIAVASERVAVRGDLPFSVPGGRIVVFGTGDMISNARIANAGALPMFLGAVNWTIGRDAALSVPARPIERFQLSLGAGELARMRYMLMLALPGIAAILGISVYWARRN